ncbi:MAG: LytR/AlgR family response regulator transcription factor [Promethearchaeota archaeon]|jgi:DNA-binding LytR/AlgR family response regulator
MKCLVVEDEPIALEIVKDYINRVSFLKLSKGFRNPIKALEYLQENKVDLLLLDINMPDLTGIQFLNALPYSPLVIFTTAYSQYALESYEYDAVDYLLKPIEFERFLRAVNKAFEHFKLRTNRIQINTPISEVKVKDHILIKSGTNLHHIKINDIFYIKGAGNYVTFFVEKQKIMALLTMDQVLEMLPSDQFLRIHKSYIVNADQIDIIENDQIKIRGKVIPIGNSFKENFLRKLRR